MKKTSYLKRIILLTLAFLMLGLTACAASKQREANGDSPATDAPTGDESTTENGGDASTETEPLPLETGDNTPIELPIVP